MLFSQARKHKVVASSTADTVGKVAELLVDPGTRRVVGLRLKKTEDGDLLAWSDITAFGADAVTVTGADKIGEGDLHLRELAHKTYRILGKRVLTTGGDELGKVGDVDFDLETGTVTSLLVDKGADVTGTRLVDVGSYAVVVTEADPS
jgi:sporulation protein YlmC with PRC-barrel domain